MRTSPDIINRLHRAAAEIEGSARSASRQPMALAGIRPMSWPFNGGDLLRVLERNGLEVVRREAKP
jgi:hypothetical protein